MSNFDMGKAWEDAVAMFSRNKEVMLIVGGVFFLLPSLAGVFVLGDFQAQAMEDFQSIIKGGAVNPDRPLPENIGTIALFGLLAALIQMVGYVALFALLDRRRPTVGEAIATGFKYLLTVLGMMILLALFFGLVMAALSIVGGILAAASGSTAMAGIAVVLAIPLLLFFLVKTALTYAVIVYENQGNPVSALLRSWRITSGHTGKLFTYFALLTIAYIVIALVISLFVVGILAALMGEGTVGLFVTTLISGVIGMVVSALLAAIIAAVYFQLTDDQGQMSMPTEG